MKVRSKSTIYLDNAATTRLDKEVVAAMRPYWEDEYGNASTTYALGARGKVALEEARKRIQGLIRGNDGHLFFTSGGTESNNWAIRGMVEQHNMTDIITSPIEHKSILDSVRRVAEQRSCQVHYVRLTDRGHIDHDYLASLLWKHEGALVSLMHGNNEIGTISDICEIGKLCRKYGAFFHTDMVQTMGYETLDLGKMGVDLATGSAHKFHGPKGSGLLYIRDGVAIVPLLYGGAQEKSLRGGTENLAGIVGMAKALSIAVEHQKEHRKQLYKLKNEFIQKVRYAIPGITVYGYSQDEGEHLGSIVSIGFPKPYNPETLLFHLDIKGVAASAGSACMSGTTKRSHVLTALGIPAEEAVVRFSFSKYTTLSEIDATVEHLIKIKEEMVPH